MTEIQKNITFYTSELPPLVRLVAISKTHPKESILEAYEIGQRIFGENKVQELTEKYHALPKDIEWHFIGHLQTNKVKQIAPFIHLIHGVDSLKLLIEINKEAKKQERIIACLLQIYIAQEETKFGLSPNELDPLFNSDTYASLQNIRIVGVMGMASNTENQTQVRKEFKQLKHLFDQVKAKYFPEEETFKDISMGMSSDYKMAIEEGSTLIRIGTAIFGEREYA